MFKFKELSNISEKRKLWLVEATGGMVADGGMPTEGFWWCAISLYVAGTWCHESRVHGQVYYTVMFRLLRYSKTQASRDVLSQS